ncbi:MAG: nucleotidyltransferase family protein [Lachnospiraceae bacterium]|nr:nucleotidyltransferase family protein [Lachnospiraceae bacterium]
MRKHEKIKANKEAYKKAAYDAAYLAACVINGEKPDIDRVKQIDLDMLYKVSIKHSMTGIVCHALESVGIHETLFVQEKGKTIQRVLLLDAAWKSIKSRLEQEKIWYMPLKGAVIKDYYPAVGIRCMADYDVLIDINGRAKVRDIMVEKGFLVESFDNDNHDIYTKAPSTSFEMHVGLFKKDRVEAPIYNYYEKIKEKLIKDSDNDFGYHFSHEDFYLYMIVHEYKHFTLGGTGLRSLLDIYVFLKKFKEVLDMEYIERETACMGFADFEKENRALALKLFSNEELDGISMQRLDYYIFSGVYGRIETAHYHMVKKKIGNNSLTSKLKYLYKRAFPPVNSLWQAYPFFDKHKYLTPLLILFRPIYLLIVKHKFIFREFKYVFKKNKRD